MSFPMVPIGSLCLKTTTRDPKKKPDETFCYIDIASIDRENKSITAASEVVGAEAPSRARKIVRHRDVLVATVRPNLNAVALVPQELNDGIASTGFAVLRADEARVSADYLYQWVKMPAFVEQLLAKVRGAQYPAVSDNDVMAAVIPLPPIEEQRRIAELLDEADRLQRLRKEANEKAQRILPALFIEMFGDPETNPMGWGIRTVGELAVKFSDGPFGSNLKSSHYVDSGVRVIRLQNIGVGEFVDDDKAFISQSHFATIAKHECRPGDVLIGTLGDPNLRAVVQPDWLELGLNKSDCVQLRPNPETADAWYLAALFNQPATLQMAQSLILGQTRGRIAMGRLRNLPVPVPPLELQRRFAELAREADSIGHSNREATRMLSLSASTVRSHLFSEAV